MTQIYFPILKAKKGELNALKGLRDDVKNTITPILQLTKPTQKKNKPLRVIDKKFIIEAANKIKSGSNGIPFIIDTTLVSLNEELEKQLIANLAFPDLFTSPDFYLLLNIDKPASIYQACLSLGYYPKKICLKVNRNNINDENIYHRLQLIIESISYSESDIILLLDLEVVNGEDFKLLDSLCLFFERVKSYFNFDSIVFGSGAFPDFLEGVTPWQYKYYLRQDWRLYKKIIEAVPGISYGDYAINTAATSDGPSFRGPSSIRYTIDDQFLVVKGANPDPLEADELSKEQLKRLSKLIVDSEYYKGADYSWGDKHIFNCAQPGLRIKLGDPTAWRTVGTSHHIVHVADYFSKPL